MGHIECGQPQKLTPALESRVFIRTLLYKHCWLPVRLTLGSPHSPKAPTTDHTVTNCPGPPGEHTHQEGHSKSLEITTQELGAKARPFFGQCYILYYTICLPSLRSPRFVISSCLFNILISFFKRQWIKSNSSKFPQTNCDFTVPVNSAKFTSFQ